jgi:hypothetical protein
MRRFVLLALGLLVAGGLAVIAPGTAQASSFVERWCATSTAHPCIVSFTKNGVPVDPSSDLDMMTTSEDPLDWGHEFQFDLFNSPDAGDPAYITPSDVVQVVFDTGAYHPDVVEGFEHQTDVDIWHAASGDWMLRITGSPVRVAVGCDDTTTWPWTCPYTATDDLMNFEGDVTTYSGDVNPDFRGFYVGTNVTYGGIFFETDASGHQYIETTAVSPHEFTDHSTVVGSIHFRLPYVMLQEDFGIPDPSTMTPGSMTGTVNGTTASFDVAQDPDGGGIYVDVSGFTFTHRTIKVKAGLITPTRPVITSTERSSATQGVVRHTLSTPRGAKVTGYVARCASGRSVVKGTGARTARGVVVRGLHAGWAYTCTVRATSKVGPSRASVAATLPRH